MGMSVLEAYERLLLKYRDLAVLASAKGVLQWDTETMMPPCAFDLRGQQLALLSKIEHSMITDREIGELLDKIEKSQGYESLDQVQKRNVYLIRKQYDENTRLPEELVTETERQAIACYKQWRDAKTAKDFKIFEPELNKMFELKKQAAEILSEVKGVKTLYDALVDFFEPKVSEEAIRNTFDQLKSRLIPIISKYSSSQPNADWLKRPVPQNMQVEIAKKVAEFINYDISGNSARGRIDPTEHPFTIGYYDDVRITTHYYEDNFMSSLFSVLHEGGHALYELNLDPSWKYQPVGTACSFGFHESQSRFVENVVGRSKYFWTYFLPIINKLTSGQFSDIDMAEALRAVNSVKPSKIRIEADEATYALHIITRFEIESALFSGKVDVKDLPQVWNEKYSKYLGVEIQNDAEGVLQDVHWAHGYFGYFPSYALGNIYCAQILNKLEKEVEDCWTEIEKGNFEPTRQWLTKNIHRAGNLYDPMELLVKVTGESINPNHFADYLEGKYRTIYG
ncbi:MAG: carboxypeptidase M32 [Candidatus Methanosuratincola verstraetei]|jgi:carboxypeptidase Taq